MALVVDLLRSLVVASPAPVTFNTTSWYLFSQYWYREMASKGNFLKLLDSRVGVYIARIDFA
jgi:hypothetical protein